MADFFRRLTDYWPDYFSFLLGVWLFFSGWILAFTDITPALLTALAFGLIIALVAFLALAAFREWEEWAGMGLGALLAISPWLFGYAALTGGIDVADGAVAATWNMVTVGVLALLLAGYGLRSHRAHEGHAA